MSPWWFHFDIDKSKKRTIYHISDILSRQSGWPYWSAHSRWEFPQAPEAHKAKSSDVSESTEQPSDTVWTIHISIYIYIYVFIWTSLRCSRGDFTLILTSQKREQHIIYLTLWSTNQVGRIDQHIRSESFHSPLKQYHKANSSDVSESTEQPSDTVWTSVKSI